MSRPWIEAAVLLAVGPLSHLPPPRGSTFSLRSIVMPTGTRFAFLPRIDAVTKPFVFDDLPALARHIERQRQGQTMQLEDVEDLEFVPPPGIAEAAIVIAASAMPGWTGADARPSTPPCATSAAPN